MEESHRFWTEAVGLKPVWALRPRPDGARMPKMRFYSGEREGKVTHHDVALVENPEVPPPAGEWGLAGAPQAISHVAIATPDRDACQRHRRPSAQCLTRMSPSLHRRQISAKLLSGRPPRGGGDGVR
jgi:hypothetical protein